MNDIAGRLQENKAEFESVLDAVLEAGAEHRSLPDNPEWTAHGIFAHLEASEQAMLTMAQIMVAKQGYQFKPYNRDEMNQKRVDARTDTPLREIADAWLATRDEMIEFAAGLDAEALAYEGTEPYWGDMTTRAVFERALHHTREHLNQVRAALDEDAPG